MESRSPFASHSDTELIRSATADPAAFEELYERHSMRLQGWLFSQTQDINLSRELLAETFAHAWRAVPRFRGEGDHSGSAWLYGIAKRRLLKYHRRKRVETAARSHLGMAVTPDDGGIEAIVARLDADELSACLRAAFLELTSDQQEAVGYRVVGELSYGEIASRTGVSTATARTRVFRGLQTLRAVLKGA